MYTFICRLISFSEFRTFESLLCTPDVISQLAFKLFDSDNKGRISFGKVFRNGLCSIVHVLSLLSSPLLSLSPSSLSLSPSLPLSSSSLSHLSYPLPPFSLLPFNPDNFKCLISATTLHQNIPFDFNTSFVKQYFGLEHTHSLDYFEFSQLLQVPTAVNTVCIIDVHVLKVILHDVCVLESHDRF